jgi:hypothetical protein
VNINTIEMMPVAQSFAPFQVARDSYSNRRLAVEAHVDGQPTSGRGPTYARSAVPVH